jgi:hypothetical protein
MIDINYIRSSFPFCCEYHISARRYSEYGSHRKCLIAATTPQPTATAMMTNHDSDDDDSDDDNEGDM